VLEHFERRLSREDEAEGLARALRRPPREPRRLTSAFLLSTVPQFLAPFQREVPGEFWSLEGEQVVVSCPCGVDPAPAVPLGGTLECPGEDCGRWYLATRNTLLCANEETMAATLEPAETEPA
jgi:hypothetical protein